MQPSSILSLVLAVSTVGGGAAAPECACLADFDALARKVVETYPGYHFEAEARVRYQAVVDSLRAVAGRTDDAECIHVLRALMGVFDDPHLFILESPAVEDSMVRRLARAAAVPLDEARIVARLRARLDALDPIEGIW